MLTDDRAAGRRAAMVDRLRVDTRLSPPVEAAFRTVPRHLFLPGVELERVYSGDVIVTRTDERQLPISSSSEIRIMAPMLQQLELSPGLRVLEIGAGTGYNAALLDEIVGPSGSVATIDIDGEIVREARERLAAAGHPAVGVECADGWGGLPDAAPFDRIELTVSAHDISPAWLQQLTADGVLVMPLVLRPNAQAVVAFRREGAGLRSTSVVPGGFVPLRGPHAPPDARTQVGPWRVTGARPVDPERLRALLAQPARLELAEDEFDWMKTWLLAIVAPDSVTLAAEGRSLSIGIAADEGVAFVASTHGAPTGGRALLVSYGALGVADRLRQLLARLRDRTFADLRVAAAPSGSERPDGESIIEREHFTFGVSLA